MTNETREFFIPEGYADPAIAGNQYVITGVLRPATEATVKFFPVPEASEVPQAPEQ